MKLLVLLILGVTWSLVENIKVSQFTAKVYKEIAKKNSDTFLVCPLSVKLVLALIELGARGQTAQEIIRTLDLPKKSQILKTYIRKLLPLFRSTEGYDLTTANRIYIRNSVQIKKKYKNDADNIFNAGIQKINFSNRQQAAQTINAWIEKRTNNKIKDMVQPLNLDTDTVMVLINAMYFHGVWVKRFNKEYTKEGIFYRSPNDQVNIDTMHIMSEFNYHTSEALSASFLEIPYKGEDITMTLILPTTFEILSNLEARINDVLVPVEYKLRNVSVTIPKFKVDTDINFKPILQQLGIKKAFGYANLSGISNTPLSVSQVIQKTFIEVNEEGTSAATATAGMIKKRTIPPFPQFVANRPFIFYLKSKIGIIFIGRYAGPK